MFYSVSLKNFKPFGASQTARLSPLTFIYGPDSAGKSSIIQSLLLLQQSIDRIEGVNRGAGPLNPSGAGHDFGTIRALVNKQKATGTVELGIGFDTITPRWIAEESAKSQANFFHGVFRLNQNSKEESGLNDHWISELAIGYPSFGAEDDRIIKFKQHRARIQRTEYGQSLDFSEQLPLVPTGVFSLGDKESIENLTDYLLNAFDVGPRGSSQPSFDDVEVVSNRKSELESLLKKTEFHASERNPILPGRTDFYIKARETFDHYKAYQSQSTLLQEDLMAIDNEMDRFLDATLVRLRKALSELIYLGPLRLPESRTLEFASNQTIDNVGKSGDRSNAAFFQAPQSSQNAINRWLGRLELDYRVQVELFSDKLRGDALSMTLRKRGNDPVIRTTRDVGFGVSQILPVIIQGIISEQKVICVEQPEIHLHPRLQADLGDFLIDTAISRRGNKGNQWIVETHSELLIQRVQRRIREGSISRDDVSVLYVDPNPKTGSDIIELRLDHEGRFIDEWPRGFFNESFEELMAFNHAGSPDVIGEI